MVNLSLSPNSIGKNNDCLNFIYLVAFLRLLVKVRINTVPLSAPYREKQRDVQTGKKIFYKIIIGMYTSDIEVYVYKDSKIFRL